MLKTETTLKTLCVPVKGMHCKACETLIHDLLVEEVHIPKVEVDRATSTVTLSGHWAEDSQLLESANLVLKSYGYRLLKPGEPTTPAWKEYVLGGLLALILIGVMVLLQFLGLTEFFGQETLDLPAVLLLGLLASVSSCFALVGGLLITYSTELQKNRPKLVPLGLGLFHGTRLVVFFVLGGILGWVGEFLQLDIRINQLLLSFAALVMVYFGLQMLGLSPMGLFKRKKEMRKSSQSWTRILASSAQLGAGVLLGALTFFLPCGFTQSVQFQALMSGSFWDGALLLLVFALGTLPVLGIFSVVLASGLQSRFAPVLTRGSGFLIMTLGVYQLYNVMTMFGWVPALSQLF